MKTLKKLAFMMGIITLSSTSTVLGKIHLCPQEPQAQVQCTLADIAYFCQIGHENNGWKTFIYLNETQIFPQKFHFSIATLDQRTGYPQCNYQFTNNHQGDRHNKPFYNDHLFNQNCHVNSDGSGFICDD